MAVPRPGQLSHPLNAKQTEDLDDQLETLFRELNVLADIFGLATAKGDIVARTDNGWVRLPAAASDDLVLTSRKSATAGMVWAEGGSSGTGAGTMRYWVAGRPYGAL